MQGTRSPPKVVRGEGLQKRIVVKAPTPQIQADSSVRPRPIVKAPSYVSLHATDTSTATARKILTNLPSSVTTRRPASPVRGTAALQQTPSTQTNQTEDGARSVKPTFFTASSFSAPRTTKLVAPELRRAESASVLPTVPRLRTESPDRIRSSGSPTPYSGRPTSVQLPSTREAYTDEARMRRRISADHVPGTANNSDKRMSRGSTLSSAGSIGTSPDVSTITQPPRRPRAPSSVTHEPPSFADVPGVDKHASAAAQSSTRRMLDYEIRNTSLMAVNHHLEKQTRRQAAELKQLRKYIQSAQGIGVVKPMSPDTSEMQTSDEEMVDEELAGRPEGVLSDELAAVVGRLDGSIQRALLVSEHLLENAQRGLAYRPRDSEVGLGVRVLLKGDDEEQEEQEEAADEEHEGNEDDDG